MTTFGFDAAAILLDEQLAAYQEPGDLDAGEVVYVATGVEPSAAGAEYANEVLDDQLDRCSREQHMEYLDVPALVAAADRGGKFILRRADGSDATGWLTFETALERYHGMLRRRIPATIHNHYGAKVSPTIGQIDLTPRDG